MNYIISIIPILLYLIFIKTMDAFAFTNWRKLVAFVVYGMVTCLVAFGITHLYEADNIYRTPLLEETIKGFLPMYLIAHKRISYIVNLRPYVVHQKHINIAFFSEAIIYGMAVGAGFALMENTMYVFFNPELSILEAIIRGFGTSLLHMGCTALLATCSLLFTRGNKWLKVSIINYGLAIVLVTAIHTIYNQFLLSPLLQMLIVVIVFLLLFSGIYSLESHFIYKWLDISINEEVKILGAIKKGELSTTHAGEYLIAMKKSFRPEIFFDVLVYYELYLELTIQAKSRLILRDAGMDSPLSEVQHAENLQQLQELHNLRKTMGPAALSALNPLIQVKKTDDWVINQLL